MATWIDMAWTSRRASRYRANRDGRKVSVRLGRDDLGNLRGLRRLVDHRVGVLDAAAIGAGVLLEQPHERVVVFATRPVALPLKQSGDGGEPNRAGLHHAGESRLLRHDGGRAAAILDNVDVVAGGQHLQGGP